MRRRATCSACFPTRCRESTAWRVDWPRSQSMIYHVDYYDRSLQQRIRGVDVDQVQSLAVKHLHPERMAVVTVGPADELAPQLERFGPVKITT